MAFSIGLIISSIRQPRICPQVADFVLQTIQGSKGEGIKKATIRTIDLVEWDLPLTGEPGIPTRIKDPSEYKLEVTRAWSREISSHDAFIFVSPQYNWGYTAVWKNAIDHLFNEWTGKPGMIVTYGGYGGTKSAAQIESVLNGLRMKPAADHVELKYPDMQFAVEKAFPGGDLSLDAGSDESVWADQRQNVLAVFDQLMTLLEEGKEVSS